MVDHLRRQGRGPARGPGRRAATPALGPAALLLGLQNGISQLSTFATHAPAGSWACGVSTEGATLLEAGHVRPAGTGLTTLGFAAPPAPQLEPRLAAAAELLNRSGCRCRLSPDIRHELWRKLVINAGINALTVIHDCPNGQLLTIPAARRSMAAAVREAAAVAAAHGIILEEDPVASTEEVCRRTAANISSTLQDSRRGRESELDAINGEIVRQGRRYQVPTPINEQLLAAV
ncbi:MAG: 2-dehydropantoate 2-reductase [Desulfurivibrio sp.]|nr:2-dehydropantoate 2-reductase [Desulfurivibrio sp.]